MKHILKLIILTSCFCLSQNLPNQYHFSEDGKKLIRGNIEFNGFYNESEIKTIYLYFDQENFWEQLHDNYCDKINISATLKVNQ